MNFSRILNGESCQLAPARGLSILLAFTSMPASDVPCSGRIQSNDLAWKRSAITWKLVSSKLDKKDGSAK